MRRFLRLIVVALMTISLVSLAAPAGAGGFVPKTVEEIEENTATCDFDGDGVYSDYWVTPEQIVLDNLITFDITDTYIHISRVMKFDGVEYTLPGGSPEAVYFTTTNKLDVVVDLVTDVVRIDLVQAGSIADADGNILFRGSWVGSTEALNDEPLWIEESGTPGFPCRFGF